MALQRQTKRKAVEKDFPHFVDILVPLGGLGTRLDAMYEFHAQHGIKPHRGHAGMMRMVALSAGALLIRR